MSVRLMWPDGFRPGELPHTGLRHGQRACSTYLVRIDLHISVRDAFLFKCNPRALRERAEPRTVQRYTVIAECRALADGALPCTLLPARVPEWMLRILCCHGPRRDRPAFSCQLKPCATGDVALKTGGLHARNCPIRPGCDAPTISKHRHTCRT
jgi:hypothetical protein